jgi:hypothetical protein
VSLGKNRLEVSRNFHTAPEYDLTPTASCEDVIMREIP